MEDREIVALFWARAEAAIAEVSAKYGGYCRAIAMNILRSHEDAEECLSDTWLGAWNAMPPQRPAVLPPLLGRIARNAALTIWRRDHAQKRDGGVALVLDELGECVGGESLEDELEHRRLGEAVAAFLDTLPRDQRRVFLRRYWYCDSVESIAARYGFGLSKVKSMLLRTRRKLRDYLTKEGFSL